MKPSIKALDAAREARTKADYFRLHSIYESRLDDVVARRPDLTREALDKAVTMAYHRWVIAQRPVGNGRGLCEVRNLISRIDQRSHSSV